MKPKLILLLLSLGSPLASAEALTEVDREALLEKLESLSTEASSKVDSRFRAATAAFTEAMSSEKAAIDLYLKCEEMVNYQKMQKSTADFNEWKRKNANRHTNNNFRTALRHQLRWLVLTLEAASEDPQRDRLALEAEKILDTIMSQAGDLAEYREILQQGVNGSVFAKAYDIKSLKVEKWPMAPAAVQAIYEEVLMPPLRNPGHLDQLRAAWTKRMFYESIMADQWSSKKPEDKPKSGDHSREYHKFMADTLPKLQWDAEVDLFNAGDQRNAAMRMLAHIEKHIAHEAAPEWAASFTTLLQTGPEAVPPPAEPAEPPSEPSVSENDPTPP